MKSRSTHKRACAARKCARGEQLLQQRAPARAAHAILDDERGPHREAHDCAARDGRDSADERERAVRARRDSFKHREEDRWRA
jgi:hypothetical protein